MNGTNGMNGKAMTLRVFKRQRNVASKMSGKAGLGFSAASCHLEVLINRTQRDRVHFMAPYNVLVLVLVTTRLSIGSESIAQNNISYPILCPNIWLACILLFDVKVKIFFSI